jgi:hypothetical protein
MELSDAPEKIPSDRRGCNGVNLKLYIVSVIEDASDALVE